MRGKSARKEVESGVLATVEVGAAGAAMPARGVNHLDHDPTAVTDTKALPGIHRDHRATSLLSFVADFFYDAAGGRVGQREPEPAFGLRCLRVDARTVPRHRVSHCDKGVAPNDGSGNLVKVISASVADCAVGPRKTVTHFTTPARVLLTTCHRPRCAI